MSSEPENVSAMSPEQLQELADRLVRQRRQPAVATPRVVPGTPAPLTYAQEALWLVDRLGTEATAYNETVALQFDGTLDVEAVRRSLEAMVTRHDALRLRMEAAADGTARQVVEPALAFDCELVDLSGHGEDALYAAVQRLADRSFDLQAAPLFRAALLRRAADVHVLVWSVHHIVWDGWSSQVFVAEFMAFLAAFRDGKPAPVLPAIPLAYVDFAVSQRARITHASLQAQRDFWRGYLDGAPSLLALPIDRERPPKRNYRGAVHRFEVPSTVLARLDALGRAAGCTLFMTLLAVFQVFLARLCGSSDIVLRTPSSGRTHPQIGGVIGLFVNLLAMRARVDGSNSFVAHLGRVRECALQAFGHQEFPYEWLVADRMRQRSLSHEPIAQVDFVLRDAQAANGVLPGLLVRPLETLHSGATNDLALIAQPSANGLKCEFVYATDLFDASTVATFAERFRQVAFRLADAPGAALDGLDMRLGWVEAAPPVRYPLDALQRMLWSRIRHAPSAGLHVIATCVTLDEDVDVARLDRAVNQVVEATDALRLCFGRGEGDRPWQRILPHVPIGVATVDLADASPDARMAARQRFARPLADAFATPAFECLVMLLGGGRCELHCRYHSLAVGADTAADVTQRVVDTYHAPGSGRPVEPSAADTSFRQQLHASGELAYGPVVNRPAGHWQAAFVRATAVALSSRNMADASVERMRLHADLEPAWLAALATLATDIGCSTSDVCFALAVLYLHRIGGLRELRLGVRPSRHDTTAGRTGLESTAIVPVVSCLDAAADLATNVRTICASLAMSLDHPCACADLQAGLPDLDGPGFRIVIDRAFDAAPPPANAEGPRVAVQPFAYEGELSIGIGLDPSGRTGRIAFDVSPSCYEAWEQASLLNAFVSFLRSASCLAPTDTIRRARLLRSEEETSVLERASGTTMVLPPTPVHRLFASRALVAPSAIAVTCAGQDISYAALDARSNQFAHELLGRGVGRGSVAGLFFERSIELVIAMLGALKAGAAYLPLDTDSPDPRLTYFLGQARPAIVVTQARFAARLGALHGHASVCVIDALAFTDRPDSDPGIAVVGTDLAYAMYTSGSTGRPKCVDTSHAALSNRLRWMQDEYAIEEADRIVQKTPYTFDVSVWEFLLPLIAGGCLVLARPEGHRDVDYLHRLLRDERITVAHFVPSMLAAFLSRVDELDTPSLRHLICSGEALSPDLAKRFLAAHATARLHNLYGPTEAAIDVTAFECRRGEVLSSVPIGRALWNTRILVLDEQLDLVPPGVPGELYIAGVGLARGYRHRPDLTADRFVPYPHATEPGARMYRTGDLARYLADGTVEYLGRRDHQVKLRGVRIELGEIEAVLVQHEHVEQAVVVIREHDGDKRLIAYVTGTDATARPESSLRDYLKGQLPAHMLPAAVVQLASLPLTANGKLDRDALPAPDDPDRDVQGNEMPAGEIEEGLARIWSRLLAIEGIGRRDNFFDLGGHSLLGIQVLAHVGAEMGVNLPFEALFECADLHALAQRIETIRWSRDAASSAGSEVAKERERLVL